MATRQDIQSVIIYMQGLFPNYKPNLDGNFNTIDAMLDALGYLDTETLRIAVKAACLPGTGRQFAPSVDEIRAVVVQMVMDASGIPTAGEAWGAVIGSYSTMPSGCIAGGGHGGLLDHPLLREAVRQMGGFTADLYENQMANRAHFFKVYQALLDAELADRTQLPAVKAYIEQNKQKLLKGCQ